MPSRTQNLLALLRLVQGATASEFSPTDWDRELNTRTEEYQNEAIFGVNRLPMRSTYFPFESRDLALADDVTKSSRYINLDSRQADPTSLWDFQWFNTTSVRLRSHWDKIAVPGIWEIEGKGKYGYPIYTNINYQINKAFAPSIRYIEDDWNGPEYNPTGVYRKAVQIPQTWQGLNVTLHFGAVNSGLYVWVNNHYVGYSEDSKLQAEFDVTDFVHEGENIIIAKVIAWTDGTFMEDQDMWRLSGISRSVYMYARPQTHVYDVHVRAEPNEDLQSGVLVVEADKIVTVEILYQEAVVARSESASQRVEIPIGNIHLWNAESPELYTVLVTSGEIFARFDVGFRRVTLSNGNFLVNGVAIKLQGVNRHEHDRRTGRVISRDAMLRDITLLKKLNFNAVRTSHYPNDEEWLRLLDQHGFYVVGEANYESHGFVTHGGVPGHTGFNHFKYNETLSNKPSWGPAIWARQQRMYYRDRNHPSIIVWSLGNEAGNGVNMIQGYEWLKSHDSNRIVTYEGARKEGDPNDGGRFEDTILAVNTDAFVPMYMPHTFLERYGQKWDQAADGNKPRPHFHIEYQHSMGNGGGDFALYWDIMDRYAGLQGGFIWDWMDQGIEATSADGKAFFKFGGDFGPANVISDGDFCLNGVLRADQVPQPHAYEIQHVQQFVKARLVDVHEVTGIIQIEIRNRFDFTTLRDLAITYRISADGRVMETGVVAEVGELRPHNVRIGQLTPKGPYMGKVCSLFVEFIAGPEARFLGWDQFGIQCSSRSSAVPVVTLDGHGNQTYPTRANDGDLQVQFNASTGQISEVLWQQRRVMSDLVPSFWRPMTDNDLGAGLNWILKYWQDVKGEWHDVALNNVNGAVVSSATYTFAAAQLEQTIIVQDAKIELHSTFTPKREACKLAGGMTFSLETETGAFLNLDASDRPVFARDLSSQAQVLSIQAKIGDVIASEPFGIDTHFYARADEPQLWAYKTSLNCTGGKLVAGHNDATYTTASYGTMVFEHADKGLKSQTFTQGDKVYLKCGNWYVVPASDGSVALETTPVALSLNIPDVRCSIPRIGHEMVLPDSFKDLQWFGKGPHDTYVDRQGAREAVFQQTVLQQTFEYGRNQASGNKYGVHWMTLTDPVHGLTITARSASGPLEMQAHHYPQRLFDAKAQTSHGNYEPRNQTVIHGGELQIQNGTWWNIDVKQMGVGGINSWGALPLPNALVAWQPYTWKVTFEFSPSLPVLV